MATLEYVQKWFSKVGRGVPQTEQVDEDGKPIYMTSDGKETSEKTEIRKTGNEQYQANQLVSVPSDSPETFLESAMEATEGEISLVASSFLSGFNKHLRLKAGGLDEFQKAARGLLKLAEANPASFPQFKGKSVDEIAEWLKATQNQ